MAHERIMIVEDEHLVAMEIEEQLKSMGYIVPYKAATGEDAVENVPLHAPDLVLMDINLPGEMDGIKAAIAIREMLNIPIIFLSGYSDKEKVQRAKYAECFGYILKPFDEKHLYTTIETALQKAKSEVKLKRSEKWYNSLINNIQEAILVTDIKGRCIYLNRFAERLFKSSLEDAVGKNIYSIVKLINKETLQPLDIPITEPIIDSMPLNYNGCLLKTDGLSEQKVNLNISPMKNSSEAVSGVILTIQIQD
jgi:PAS domain S-box-containing protein